METRKHLPRAVLARIYFIDRQIASGKYPNVNTLAKEYEVGTATIYRDIEYMKYMLNAPIEYSAKHRGWFYEEKTFRLPARFAAADDMLALGMAKNLMTLYKDTPLYEAAKRLLDDITAPLSSDDIVDVKQSAWYENRIIVPPVASIPVKPEIWEIIINAMRDNRIIAFEYKGIWDSDYGTRLVKPYQLLFDTGAWFLYGYAEERSAIRIFSLSRIQNATLTNEVFSLPKDFEYGKQNDDSYFGIFLGVKKKFKIAFASNAAIDIQERKWAANQKIETDKNGITIFFTSTQYNKILAWVLSYGINARPIEPQELVKEWEKNITALYEKIRK
jgi:predicted DNA-binding transcriptional regulator YafY